MSAIGGERMRASRKNLKWHRRFVAPVRAPIIAQETTPVGLPRGAPRERIGTPQKNVYVGKTNPSAPSGPPVPTPLGDDHQTAPQVIASERTPFSRMLPSVIITDQATRGLNGQQRRRPARCFCPPRKIVKKTSTFAGRCAEMIEGGEFVTAFRSNSSPRTMLVLQTLVPSPKNARQHASRPRRGAAARCPPPADIRPEARRSTHKSEGLDLMIEALAISTEATRPATEPS